MRAEVLSSRDKNEGANRGGEEGGGEVSLLYCDPGSYLRL